MEYWKQDSILNNQREKTPPKEIYQAVCNAMGNYFKEKGYKYSKSIPKITKKDKDFKIEIVFRSSGSNAAGKYVNLEINGFLQSLELTKLDPTDNGCLNTSTTSLGKILEGNHIIGTKFVEQINGEVISYIENRDFNEYTLNRNINLYGLNKNGFEKIISFIQINLIDWLEKLKEKDTLMDCLKECSKHSKIGLQRTSFLKFIEYKYPEMLNDVQEELKNYR